jgi:hypothetical protein
MHRSTILSWPAGRLARAALLAAGLALAAAAAAPAAASAAPTPTLTWNVVRVPVTSYDFSTHGGTNGEQVFTVLNSSQSATSALTITVTGSPAFTKQADTCTGTSLSPGAFCVVQILFQPLAPVIIGHQYKGIATAALHGSQDGTTMTLTGAIFPAH